MEKLGFIKECINDVKGEINILIEENGKEMYEGVFEVIEEMEKYEWEKLINYLNELEEEDDEDEDFLKMVCQDSVDRELMGRFGKQFGENLKKLGYEYNEEEEYWNIKDKRNGEDLTCYGVIWDYWYDLDTDVRESVGEIFENEII